MPPSDSHLDRLFRAARHQEADISRLEFAFETRVMARVREETSGSIFTWAWKLAPLFGALAIAAGIWSQSATAAADSIGSVVVEAAAGHESETLVHYLTGEP